LAIATKTQLLKCSGLQAMDGGSVWEMSCHVMPTLCLHFPMLPQTAWFFIRGEEDSRLRFKIYQCLL